MSRRVTIEHVLESLRRPVFCLFELSKVRIGRLKRSSEERNETRMSGAVVQTTGNLYYLPSGEGVCIKKCPKSTDLQTYICKYNVQDELDLIEAEFGTLAVRAPGAFSYVGNARK